MATPRKSWDELTQAGKRQRVAFNHLLERRQFHQTVKRWDEDTSSDIEDAGRRERIEEEEAQARLEDEFLRRIGG